MGELNRKLTGKETAKGLAVAVVLMGVFTLVHIIFDNGKATTAPPPAPQQASQAAKPSVESSSFEAERKEFIDVLVDSDLVSIVKRVDKGFSDNQLAITVYNNWHYEPHQIRKQAGEMLWEIWARIHSPDDVDKARISILDLNGNKVGGSRFIAGSMIWMDERDPGW